MGRPSFYSFPNLKSRRLSDVVVENEIDPIRTAEIWQRHDYDMLSKTEMSELIQIYLEGRSNARKILQEMAAAGRFEKLDQDTSSSIDLNQKKLL